LGKAERFEGFRMRDAGKEFNFTGEIMFREFLLGLKSAIGPVGLV
jgi:hypothetical protein